MKRTLLALSFPSTFFSLPRKSKWEVWDSGEVFGGNDKVLGFGFILNGHQDSGAIKVSQYLLLLLRKRTVGLTASLD